MVLWEGITGLSSLNFVTLQLKIEISSGGLFKLHVHVKKNLTSKSRAIVYQVSSENSL